MERYSPLNIEKKWREVWEKEKIYQPHLTGAEKPFYNLMMFPYPSAEGLHVGNMYAFTGADVYGRFKRMQGFDVFEPIGLDGFGIHSENYAIKKGTHPAIMAKKTESRFYDQLRSIGNGFAWDEKLETYDPTYYRWTQWIFVKLFKAGLAYRAQSSVSYCPSCKTVLADEQVIKKSRISEHSEKQRIGGFDLSDKPTIRPSGSSEFSEINVCERCGTEVERRALTEWFFRITAYAERLLDNLKRLDWSEKVKTAQRNWIGKKNGALIKFSIHLSVFPDRYIEVFTTRPETIFGATFIVLSLHHPISQELASRNTEIEGYLEQNRQKRNPEEAGGSKGGKSGVFSGYYAVNPVNNLKIPIWVSDYVLTEYGTGAIMGVPAHDRRDFEFALNHNLPVIRVIKGEKGENKAVLTLEDVWEGDGVVIESGFLNNLTSVEAKKAVIEFLKDCGLGGQYSTYHLRDWTISRQRYWGPPIPMIYCEKCAEEGKSWFDTEESRENLPLISFADKHGISQEGSAGSRWEAAGWFPVPENELPVNLPEIENFRPTGEGVSPLANVPSFYKAICPNCGGNARRETDVSDTFLDSAWYFLRYPSVTSDQRPMTGNQSITKPHDSPWDQQITRRWLPVNTYIGGAEHSVLHLLYSRFIAMVFSDLGYLHFEEPFTKFRAHGLLIREGAKMSKSKGNVINPDEYIAKFGADTLRTYLMFIGPFDQGGDFRDSGIAGIYRFLGRVWDAVTGAIQMNLPDVHRGDHLLKRELSRTIKKVGDDVENLHFNTAIASLMEFLNLWQKNKDGASMEVMSLYIKLLAPFAPYMAEELWQRVKKNQEIKDGNKSDSFQSVHKESWPTFEERDLAKKEVTFIVQVNGKVRGRIILSLQEAGRRDLIEVRAKGLVGVYKYLEHKEVKNTIFVPGKLINFVV